MQIDNIAINNYEMDEIDDTIVLQVEDGNIHFPAQPIPPLPILLDPSTGVAP